MGGEFTETDEYYIASTLDGDTDAFHALVHRYQNRAFTLAFGILREREVAEDVVQDAFVKAFKALRRFRREAGFATWLHTIVVRTALDERKRRKPFAPLDAMENEVSSSLPESQDLLHADDRKAYLKRALDALRPDEALVLRLFYLAEFSLKEIQGATGFSPAKIRVDLHRGRGRLHERLREYLGDELDELL